ncbi:hypothetical protein Tco_0303817 [Tanacetum coccineum]
MGLWVSEDTVSKLTAFSDSDHAGCLDSRKSTTGGIQFLGGDKLVIWSSKKQDYTSMSSADRPKNGVNYNLSKYKDDVDMKKVVMDPVMQCTTLPGHSKFPQKKLVSFVTEIHTLSIDISLRDLNELDDSSERIVNYLIHLTRVVALSRFFSPGYSIYYYKGFDDCVEASFSESDS